MNINNKNYYGFYVINSKINKIYDIIFDIYDEGSYNIIEVQKRCLLLSKELPDYYIYFGKRAYNDKLSKEYEMPIGTWFILGYYKNGKYYKANQSNKWFAYSRYN